MADFALESQSNCPNMFSHFAEARGAGKFGSCHCVCQCRAKLTPTPVIPHLRNSQQMALQYFPCGIMIIGPGSDDSENDGSQGFEGPCYGAGEKVTLPWNLDVSQTLFFRNVSNPNEINKCQPSFGLTFGQSGSNTSRPHHQGTSCQAWDAVFARGCCFSLLRTPFSPWLKEKHHCRCPLFRDIQLGVQRGCNGRRRG